MARHDRGQALIQFADVRHPAAQDKDLGVGQIDHHGQGSPQSVDVAVQGDGGFRVACARSLDHGLGLPRAAGRRLMVALEARA
ncbi:hypothetical protein D3C72_1602600 [compost metagenome]